MAYSLGLLLWTTGIDKLDMLLATSEITREVDRAFILIGGMSLLLLLAITVATVYIAVRFRRSRARTTSQVNGNTTLEIVWTIIPTIIVFWMFAVGYKGFGMMGRVPEDHMVVDVIGKQWAWSFSYPEEGVSSRDMVVPVDRAVLVRLTAPAGDVIHSFFIPAFRVKEDALPGQETSLWFQAERKGTYDILCAESAAPTTPRWSPSCTSCPRATSTKWVRTKRTRQVPPAGASGRIGS